MLKDRKGFTLAELLIVVGMIAMLVSIAVVTYGSALERSRESVDIANVRSAVNEVVAQYVSSGEVITKRVSVQQRQEGWQTEPTPSFPVGGESYSFDAKTSGEYMVTIDVAPDTLAIIPKVS